MTDQPAAVDLEFERGALGCLLLGESVLDALMDGLTSQDFYR
jgi:replicative DNA helicase